MKDRDHTIAAVTRHCNPYTADLPRLLTRAKAAKIAARGRVSYCNLGAALLGHALAAQSGTEYPELLDRRLFKPLGMTRSTTPLTSCDLSADAPTGSNAHGEAEQAWTMGAYANAGGVRSTPDGMARYVQALLDGTAPGLTALTPRWYADGHSRVGHAWFTDRIDGVDVIWHNGATGGFSRSLALDHVSAAAVIALANTAVALDGIAITLLLDAILLDSTQSRWSATSLHSVRPGGVCCQDSGVACLRSSERLPAPRVNDSVMSDLGGIS